MKKILLLCALAVGLSAATAQAALITPAQVGESGTVTFNGNVNGIDVPGLTAAITFTLDAYDTSNNKMVFTVALDNTSSAPITNSRVSAFGFNTDPDVTGGSTNSTIFEYVVTGGQFPNGFGNIDVCVKGQQANNCTGGGPVGPFPDTPVITFQLTLNFSNLTADGVDFTNFGVRYQSIDGQGPSGKLKGDSGTGKGGTPVGRLFGSDPDPVPEPTSLVMLGLGLLGAGLARRRK